MHVLLADDQPQIRSALRLLLEQEGEFEVVGEAVNSESLLTQVQAKQPDLVLLDWELPGRLITQLLPLLRQAAPRAQVVVLSSRLEARHDALVAGSDAFISKGYPPEHLLDILHRLKKTQKKAISWVNLTATMEVCMYKTILVPLDGSNRAEVILPHVENLAQWSNATVLLLGVVEPEPIMVFEPVAIPFDNQLYEAQVKATEKYLHQMGERLKAKNIVSQVFVGQGRVVEQIIQVSEEKNVDLIAMVSHGRTGLAQVFYGSVAVGVLHRVNRPLLIIRSIEQQS
jgi:nucleotide-binding universal stress UspA family protein/CheY-like chemotaxis protein